MRLTQIQRDTILSGVREFAGASIDTHVFGSRLDDTRRGGDVDLLLISPAAITLLACAELKMALEERLQLPVDILTYVSGTEPTPFQAIALAQSQPLNTEEAA
ncbi:MULTISPECIES: nucleotidyltransferase family protein [Vreelandella]|uniref:Nucleotidyltransferase domain-containing protein n=2 Tax=Vreelandella TaxID=3137766 RepID=A0A7C9P829_9GAMM|nr:MULTISPECIES: nucleotidyltransferase domain-containing protein [Halomonas]NDL70975.1 nucleotidyltransferase domain-containing protein [Halomonas alkaliphila]NYS46371.1 nucleotidyltransferase domain-containing protein [Halomonas zhaodongensis]